MICALLDGSKRIIHTNPFHAGSGFTAFKRLDRDDGGLLNAVLRKIMAFAKNGSLDRMKLAMNCG